MTDKRTFYLPPEISIENRIEGGIINKCSTFISLVRPHVLTNRGPSLTHKTTTNGDEEGESDILTRGDSVIVLIVAIIPSFARTKCTPQITVAI